MAADRILFVDDEKGVLDGYERLLHKEFYVSVASSGQEGLAAIEEHGPFSVVISDMRMPGMNGAEFLSQVKQRAPDTIRMLLTGYTDLKAAIDAVNEGNIFRFLTKPSSKEVQVIQPTRRMTSLTGEIELRALRTLSGSHGQRQRPFQIVNI